MNMNRKGFTLVEIMIVVAIIGILAAIAIPNFLKSRKTSQMNSCIANMKQLEGAREQAMLAGTPDPTLLQLCGETCYVKITPVCPATKVVYALPAATETIVCPSLGADADYPHKLYK